ncbi:hypothetical protein P0F65_22035 [Sphingomonas sp. I4]
MFDHVFDATGNIHAMCAGLNWVAHGGTYTLVGVCKDELVFADPEFHKRETTLIASRNALSVDFDHVIASIRSGAIPTDAIATHRLSLDDAPRRLPELIAQADLGAEGDRQHRLSEPCGLGVATRLARCPAAS